MLKGIAVWVATTTATMGLSGLAVMMLVAAAHSLWWQEIPRIGFWPAVLIAGLARLAFTSAPTFTITKEDGRE